MKCKLVDVFAKEKFSGNGLTIFYDYDSLDKNEMLSLTQEMRQFESIFVKVNDQDLSIRAKIFTVEEELDFAGHPIIGLAAHLHEESGDLKPREWKIDLNKTKTAISISKLIKLKIGDTFRVVVYHNERHLIQAEKILNRKAYA